MLRGLYQAGTAMLSQNRRMEVITNNLVNVETTGYKENVMVTQSFKDMMISRLNDPSVYEYSYVGPHNTGIHIDTIKTSFAQGPLVETSNPLDLALDSDGYFVVEYTPHTVVEATAEEKADPDYEPEYEYGDPVERYTRAGNFAVNSEGALVTPSGHYVLGQGGYIQVGTQDFEVNSSGEIMVNGEFIDTLRTVRFEDNNVLRHDGRNFFKIMEEVDEFGDAVPLAEPDDVTVLVKQGFLEQSNVDVASETVRMMECYRAYEINQRMVKMYDESLGKAVNDIARI